MQIPERDPSSRTIAWMNEATNPGTFLFKSTASIGS